MFLSQCTDLYTSHDELFRHTTIVFLECSNATHNIKQYVVDKKMKKTAYRFIFYHYWIGETISPGQTVMTP